MGDFSKDDKNYVKFLGFKFECKQFFITTAVALGVILFLIALTLFGVEISWYGVLVGVGFLVALALSGQLFETRKLPNEYGYSLIWWIFPCSIIGARLYFLIFDGGIDSFSEIFKIWNGGLAIYGGVIGGAIGLLVCALIKKLSVVDTTDCVVPLLAIGQAFGRIGCIFGHCCYGVEVSNESLQWFPIALDVNGGWHYATNFYESILDFCLFLALIYILRKVKIKGITTCSYLTGYGLVRFILEFFRDKKQTLFIGDFPVSQLLSIICVVIGVIGICTLLFVNNRKVNREVDK